MWSPQHYIEIGRQLGADEEVVAAAIEQIDTVVSGAHRLPSILTLKHLAVRTGVSYMTLRSVVERRGSPYKSFYMGKRSGGRRLISIPNSELMRTQRWLSTYVLRDLPVNHYSFAFQPKRSIADCAARHTGARWLFKMDVQDFFGSVTEIKVFRIFQKLGYEPLISFELARICTYLPPMSRKYSRASWQNWRERSAIPAYHERYIGRLPQGAPTSPMLSNLAMCDLDQLIARHAMNAGLTYTRYSDDLTFSTRKDNIDRVRALAFIRVVSSLLKGAGLYVNARKTVIVPPGARKVVLGLLVDGPTPRLSPNLKSCLRQHIYYLRRYGPFEHAKRRSFDTVGGLYRHVRGLIDFAHMVEPAYADKLLSQFEEIAWPA